MSSIINIKLRRVIDDSYDIHVGLELEEIARRVRREYRNSSMFVITDRNVAKLYGPKFLKALGLPSRHILIVPAGERSKSRKTKEHLEDKLLTFNAMRSSTIIALGGGVIGDLAGFVAANLLRGIRYIQIPTTLLAQVDSSIGGKVAVDHPLGKNLIGAFHQPSVVYIDPSTLNTLPDSEFISGMAEVIKYAAILDASLFDYLEINNNRIRSRHSPALQHIIGRCCMLKKSIVEKDEKESGLRRILNFGHTIGHAVEQLSHYRISHGQAVAIGMVCEAKMSLGLSLLSKHSCNRIERLIDAYHLPTALPSRFDADSVLGATTHDKKARGNTVDYTLLERIGKARVGVPISIEKAIRLLNS